MVAKPKEPKKRRDWVPKFLETLALHGVVAAAAVKAGVVPSTAYDRRAGDREFAAAWDNAIETAIGGLELEAWRRASEGVTRAIYQGGKKVGSVCEYSDTLLIFLLKARRPAVYREPRSEVHVHNAAPALDPGAAKAALEAIEAYEEAESWKQGELEE